MATTTSTILGLTIPTPGTKEPYSRTLENANMALLENAIGAKSVRFTTVTLSNSTTETQMWGGSVPANPSQGSCYRLEAWGTYDNSGTATTLNFRTKIGSVQCNIIGIATPASAQTNQPWSIDFDIVVSTTGGSGIWRPRMKGMFLPAAGAFNAIQIPSAGTTRDTTVSNTMEITAQWIAASASNTIRCDAAIFKRLSNA
jgi:hypothetical protein